jgi:hypothetical protein
VDPDPDPDSDFLFDADPDPTFHLAFKKRFKPHEKNAKIGSYFIHFGLTSVN